MEHTGTVRIETKRLVLRPFEPGDGEAMYRNWASDPYVTRFLRWDTHGSVAESEALMREWVEKNKDPENYHWGIVLKATGELIGAISVGENGCCAKGGMEPGYCIGKKWWGMGLMTEAHCAVVDYMFEVVGVEELCICHAKQNPASGRVIQKTGFRLTGEGVYERFDGTKLESLEYSLTRGERRAFELENA